jgi:hypothetical protein
MVSKKGNIHGLKRDLHAGYPDASRRLRLDEMPPHEFMPEIFMLRSALDGLLCIGQFTGLFSITRDADEDCSTRAQRAQVCSFLLVSQKSGQKSLPSSTGCLTIWMKCTLSARSRILRKTCPISGDNPFCSDAPCGSLAVARSTLTMDRPPMPPPSISPRTQYNKNLDGCRGAHRVWIPAPQAAHDGFLRSSHSVIVKVWTNSCPILGCEDIFLSAVVSIRNQNKRTAALSSGANPLPIAAHHSLFSR